MTTTKRDLRLVTADGAAYSVMVGLGETYLAAFALAIGFGEVFAGLLAVVPLLAGALLGLVSPRIVRRLRSHRRFVVLCAISQAAAFVPLVAAALVGAIPGWALFAVASLYWASGLATGPAWNTWVATLVPAEIRARYFGRRSRIVQLCLLGALLTGGAALHWLGGRAAGAAPFAALFALAGLARLASVKVLAATSEPEPMPPDFREVRAGELVRRFVRAQDGRFLLYLLVVQAAVQLAAPFFTPFMLGELRLSYVEYMGVTATAYVAKVLASPLLGEYAHRYGARRLMWIGGFGIVPLAGLWVVSQELWWLLAIQVVSGTAWAAYELGYVLLVFDAIRPEERTSVLTIYNLANAVAMVAGGLLGGLILQGVGLGLAGYFAIFLFSTLARGASLLFLRGAAPLEPAEIPYVVSTRPLAVRPSAGSIERPVLPGLPESGPAEAEPATMDAVR